MKVFFEGVRKLFPQMKQSHVDGMNRIVEYGQKLGVSRLHLAYILATAYHETAGWMLPIREGATRYGPSYTDEQSRRAVAAIFAKGIIRTNYALPAGPYKQSYYGRGYVQITWYDNYKKFADLLDIPLDRQPDLALDVNYSLPILFTGMLDGLFTGKSLKTVTSQADYVAARAIVNGDVKKNGPKIAAEAVVFYNALASYTPKEESTDEPERSGWCRFAPAWWPF